MAPLGLTHAQYALLASLHGMRGEGVRLGGQDGERARVFRSELTALLGTPLTLSGESAGPTEPTTEELS